MPLMRVRAGGKPAYRWGHHGKAYTYTSGNRRSREKAKKRAIEQGLAIEYRKHSGRRPKRFDPDRR